MTMRNLLMASAVGGVAVGGVTEMSYAVKFTGPPYSGGGGVGPMNSSRALSVPPSTALQLGNSLDFTIELWVKNNGVIYNGVDYGANFPNGWQPLISQSVIDEGHGNNTGWVISIQDLKISLHPWLSYTPNTTTRGRYIHIAVVRRLGTTSLYVNGVSVASSSSVFDMNSAINVRSDTPFIIGGHELVVSTTCYCNISNVRVLTRSRHPYQTTVRLSRSNPIIGTAG